MTFFNPIYHHRNLLFFRGFLKKPRFLKINQTMGIWDIYGHLSGIPRNLPTSNSLHLPPKIFRDRSDHSGMVDANYSRKLGDLWRWFGMVCLMNALFSDAYQKSTDSGIHYWLNCQLCFQPKQTTLLIHEIGGSIKPYNTIQIPYTPT